MSDKKSFDELMQEISKDASTHEDYFPEMVRMTRENLASLRARPGVGGDASRDDELARRMAYAGHVLMKYWPQLQDEIRLPAHFSPADRAAVLGEINRLSEVYVRMHSRFATNVLNSALTSIAFALTGVALTEQAPFDKVPPG